MRVSTLLPLFVAGLAVAAPLDSRRNRGKGRNQVSTVTVTVTVSADCAGATTIVDNGDDTATDDEETSSVAATPTAILLATTKPPTATTTGVIKVSGAKGILEPSAVAESQAFDDTATRAATGVTIKDSDGNCLSVDITEGDFRENLIPVRPKPCDGSDSQKWDFITKGKHNNAKDATLIVNSNNGCLNFDDRRAAGDQVIMFSCGGRADGDSETTDSQLFPFPAGTDLTKPFVLSPLNAKGARCMVEKNGRLDNEACNAAAPAANQQFLIGGAAPATGNNAGNGGAATSPVDAATTTQATTTAVPATTTKATATTAGPIKVSGAKGVLEPSAVAESQAFDDTATRAATGVQIKDSDGNCLSVDITEGDFRENLIPIRPKPCDGSDSQKWDFITKGKHNNAKDATLIVNSNNGCLNFDDRRAAGDQVIMFSCGGRADGVSGTTDSQLFPFPAGTDLSKPFVLSTLNAKGARCMVEKNGRLDNEACNAAAPAANQQFTIVA